MADKMVSVCSVLITVAGHVVVGRHTPALELFIDIIGDQL